MKYPKFIKKGDTIGICAPSSGVGKFVQKYKRRLITCMRMVIKQKKLHLYAMKVSQVILQSFVQKKLKNSYLIKM